MGRVRPAALRPATGDPFAAAVQTGGSRRMQGANTGGGQLGGGEAGVEYPNELGGSV